MSKPVSKLSDLHYEYLRGHPHSTRTQKRVIREYKANRARRLMLEEKLEQAKQGEYLAAEEVVKVFGSQPVVIDGESYDAACKGSTVFLIKRAR